VAQTLSPVGDMPARMWIPISRPARRAAPPPLFDVRNVGGQTGDAVAWGEGVGHRRYVSPEAELVDECSPGLREVRSPLGELTPARHPGELVAVIGPIRHSSRSDTFAPGDLGRSSAAIRDWRC
jgi:hypothetical protein